VYDIIPRLSQAHQKINRAFTEGRAVGQYCMLEADHQGRGVKLPDKFRSTLVLVCS